MHEYNMSNKKFAVPLLSVLFAFFVGALFAGFFFCRQRPANAGELDTGYDLEHTRAAEIIGRLENELGRERELNSQLREHNNRARNITEELAGTSERNVRNLHDAVSLIGEIRQKLQVLADFYADSHSAYRSD